MIAEATQVSSSLPFFAMSAFPSSWSALPTCSQGGAQSQADLCNKALASPSKYLVGCFMLNLISVAAYKTNRFCPMKQDDTAVIAPDGMTGPSWIDDHVTFAIGTFFIRLRTV